MIVHFLDLLSEDLKTEQVKTSLTLVPFYNFLKRKLKDGSNIRSSFFEYAISVIEDTPGWDKGIETKELDKFTELFQLVYFTFSSPVIDESKSMWALARPFTQELFFETDGIHKMLTNHEGKLKKDLLNEEIAKDMVQDKIKIIYSLILERFYHFSTGWQLDSIHAYHDREDGIRRYYRLTVDNQFIEIKYKGELPELDLSLLEFNKENTKENIEFLQSKLPFEIFSFEGFTIVGMADITNEYASARIRDMIVNMESGAKVYSDVAALIKELLNNKNMEVTLLPMLMVNGQLAIDSYEESEKYLDNHCCNQNFDKNEYLTALLNYSNNPRLIVNPELNKSPEEDGGIVNFFRERGFLSVGVIPVFNHLKLVGILEILSKEKDALSVQCISVLNPLIPLLQQLLQNTIDNFYRIIDDTILKNFTTLQPAVQWRFSEAAWHYLQQKQKGKKEDIEQIQFREVYPLYGAIDIRDSTKNRNKALQSDNYYMLYLLTELLKKLHAETKMEIMNQAISKAYSWGNRILETITPEMEIELYTFFKYEAIPLISHFRGISPALDKEIDNFFRMSENGGKAFENRADLEKSFGMLNTLIENKLEEMNSHVQEIYPCYFEKMRTDGVEYNIYIGQSISPQKKFDTLFLKDLRLEQLISLIGIARETNAIKSHLPKKLETTQLVFIHSNPIDISFRRDERRFDVEGAYNIRYEIAKKRIDKVHIKNSKERLTQPGKIAMVYFQQHDIDEYLSYIQYLQSKNMLTEKVEFLELEYVQGISGLKALRVTIKM